MITPSRVCCQLELLSAQVQPWPKWGTHTHTETLRLISTTLLKPSPPCKENTEEKRQGENQLKDKCSTVTASCQNSFKPVLLPLKKKKPFTAFKHNWKSPFKKWGCVLPRIHPQLRQGCCVHCAHPHKPLALTAKGTTAPSTETVSTDLSEQLGENHLFLSTLNMPFPRSVNAWGGIQLFLLTFSASSIMKD